MELIWVGTTYYGDPAQRVIDNWAPQQPRYSMDKRSLFFDGEYLGVKGKFIYNVSEKDRTVVGSAFIYKNESRSNADAVYDKLKAEFLHLYGDPTHIDYGIKNYYYNNNKVILSTLHWYESHTYLALTISFPIDQKEYQVTVDTYRV